MRSKKEPKVLVIAANPFSDVNNNGKTLKSIFSSFDKSSLFNLYFRPQDNVIGDGEFAQSYYAVSELDIIRSFIHFKKKCGGIQIFERGKDESISKDPTYRRFLRGNLKDNKFIRSLLWKSRRWDTPAFRKWYHDCNPDVVFALLGDPGVSYTIAEEISKDLNIPLVIYYTDDFLLHPIGDSFINKLNISRKIKAYRRIVELSSARYCIGEKMCEEYSRFFHSVFMPIMNSVEKLPFRPQETINSPIVISYFGGLSLGRWEMISRFADIVEDLAIVRVYTTHEITEEIRRAFNKTNIEICGKVVGEELTIAREASDCLLHVESDNEQLRKRTALSLSTKIPESMMQSRLLIGFGPSEVASMQLLQKYDIGLFISSELSIEQQKTVFLQSITDTKMYKIIVEKAYQYACSHFDKHYVSTQLKKDLTSLIENK